MIAKPINFPFKARITNEKVDDCNLSSYFTIKWVYY